MVSAEVTGKILCALDLAHFMGGQKLILAMLFWLLRKMHYKHSECHGSHEHVFK